MLRPRRRSALLVDYDNLDFALGPAFTDKVENWLAWLEEGGFDPENGPRKFLSKTIYWNDDRKEHFRPLLQRHGFRVAMCRAIRKEKASSADFDITIDMVEMRHSLKGLQEVILLSFDSDFVSVLNHMLVNDITAWGLVDGDNRPAQMYRKVIGNVIERPALVEAFRYQRPKRLWWGGRREQPLLPAPEAKADAAAPRPDTPRPAPRARGRAPSRAPAGAPNADVQGALDVVLKAAAQSPSARISKNFVREALKDFPGFRDTGHGSWLGCGSYPHLAASFTSMSPLQRTETFDTGMKVLVYVGERSDRAA